MPYVTPLVRQVTAWNGLMSGNNLPEKSISRATLNAGNCAAREAKKSKESFGEGRAKNIRIISLPS
jgi:hypothetical protein